MVKQKRVICRCISYRCGMKKSENPDTHEIVTGYLVDFSTEEKHRKADIVKDVLPASRVRRDQKRTQSEPLEDLVFKRAIFEERNIMDGKEVSSEPSDAINVHHSKETVIDHSPNLPNQVPSSKVERRKYYSDKQKIFANPVLAAGPDITDELADELIKKLKLQDTRIPDRNEEHCLLKLFEENLNVLDLYFDQLDTLVFEFSPTSTNDIPSRLEQGAKSNRKFLKHEDRLSQTIMELENIKSNDPNVETWKRKLIKKAENQQLKLDNFRLEKWGEEKVRAGLLIQTPEIAGTSVVRNLGHGKLDFFREHPLLVLICFTALTLHLLEGVSDASCTFLLVCIRAIVTSSFTFASGQPQLLTSLQKDFVNGIAIRIKTIVEHLDLEPKLIRYACCKSCFALHSPTGKSSDGKDIFAEVCGYRRVSKGSECRSRLTEIGEPSIPLREYLYQPFKIWLARFLSRPGIEDHFDYPWQTCNGDPYRRPSIWTDIWHGNVLQNLKGPDKKSHFSKCTVDRPTEGQLIFSIFVDWFNPFKNKKAGKTSSVGAIYMCCLNLPKEIRYKIENVFLAGIIPGPSEPSKDQINHFLRPIVDELREFWYPGVYFERTAKYKFGRWIRCAVLPLVADLPAARKAGGAIAVTATLFCSFCLLLKTQLNSILDPEQFPRRTEEYHRTSADAYATAETELDQEKSAMSTGVRWSELLRLDYWQPVSFAAVDAMHNLFLGNFKHHCRRLFNMPGMPSDKAEEQDRSDTVIFLASENADVTSQGEAETQLKRSNIKNRTEDEHWEIMLEIGELVNRGRPESLKRFPNLYLEVLCTVNGIQPKASGEKGRVYKNDYVQALKTLMYGKNVIKLPQKDEMILKIRERPQYSDFTEEVMEQIRSDIGKITVPSWVSPPPRKFGQVRHGKLKADEWRIVCTVALVLSLGVLWGNTKSTDRHRDVLNNFYDLVIATNWATKRTLSLERISIYETYIKKYVKGAVKLYGFKLVQNNHISLHLPDCLRNFGPVYSWWAFPFERFNGIIACIASNFKIGEMEGTFMRSFCRAANFRAMLQLDSVKKVLEPIIPRFEKHFRWSQGYTSITSVAAEPDDTDGSLFLFNRTNLKRLSGETLHELEKYLISKTMLSNEILEPFAKSVKRVRYGKLAFVCENSLNKRHRRRIDDSLIMFRSRTSSEGPLLGRIQEIIVHPFGGKARIFFLVKLFQRLSEKHRLFDPFAAHPLLETETYYSQCLNETEIIEREAIVGHVASMKAYLEGMDEIECIVAMSLNRD